jgi:hypothetical protein
MKPRPFQFTDDMQVIYTTTNASTEQMCRETVIRLVKDMRRIGFNPRRRYRYEELPAFLRDLQGSQHSGYSFGCSFNHAMLIHRFGWKSYAAQSRAIRRQRL